MMRHLQYQLQLRGHLKEDSFDGALGCEIPMFHKAVQWRISLSDPRCSLEVAVPSQHMPGGRGPTSYSAHCPCTGNTCLAGAHAQRHWPCGSKIRRACTSPLAYSCCACHLREGNAHSRTTAKGERSRYRRPCAHGHHHLPAAALPPRHFFS